ncbi:hypothetical protein FA95DRAFT_1607243 [Auriscalpium vulgare]|uniref:Uncharacterized protein n=1 Tax=Auriscalpium vulgare TaxID=40419 RepID=A0ACB8RPQ6_9AGAM|nr:hypothetical protein FA95DRAFT_1607243 [Auriscalpium vulgare]
MCIHSSTNNWPWCVLRDALEQPRDATFSPAAATPQCTPPPAHIVNAYCRTSLFAISSRRTVVGIKFSADSISFATLNVLPAAGQCDFRSGDAAIIFGIDGEFRRMVAVVDPLVDFDTSGEL